MRKTTLLGLAAAALTAISTFLPIISMGPISVNVWDGVKMKGDNGAAIILMVLAGLIALFAFLANKKHLASIGTLIMAAVVILIGSVWYKDAAAVDSVGFGLYVLILGGFAGVVSAVMGFMKK